MVESTVLIWILEVLTEEPRRNRSYHLASARLVYGQLKVCETACRSRYFSRARKDNSAKVTVCQAAVKKNKNQRFHARSSDKT